jgi:hypothetical protein
MVLIILPILKILRKKSGLKKQIRLKKIRLQE